MEINGISTSSSIPLERTTRPAQAEESSSDQAVLNTSAASFSSLVKEASQMPEVRDDVVDAFKARIQSGQYPSDETVAGLARVIGGGVMELAQS